MTTVVARHKVSDIDAWIKGHHDRVKIFEPAVSAFKSFQDTDDPTSVILILEVTDMEKLMSIMSDPKLADMKASHTVIEPIIISMPLEL